MKAHLITFLLITSLWIVSCTTESGTPDTPIPTEPELVEMTFTVTIEGEERGNDTKTYFSGKTSNTKRHVYWKAGDQISIFDGYGNRQFTLASDAGTTTGTFNGRAVPNANTYYALYPYQPGAIINNETLQNVSLPSTQTASKTGDTDSFDPTACLMVAKSTASGDATLFQFKNVCGFLRLTRADSYNVDKIVFTSLENNASLPLAGTLNIGFNNDGTPNPSATSSTNSITINTGSGIDTFYVAMLPTTFKGNFYISYYSGNNPTHCKFYSASNKELKIARSTIQGIKISSPQPLSDEWVDLGMKKNGTTPVLWRAWNLGASSPQTAGYFYAWAEAKHRDYTIATTPTSSGTSYYQITSSKPFNLSNTPYYDSSKTGDQEIHFSKYNTAPSGDVGDALSTDDDAATQELSTQKGVRMPTINELVWLQDTKNCEYFRVGNFMGSGISGCVFKSKITGYTGNWIFMPMLGNCQEDKNYYDQKGTTSPYWSSNYAKNPNYAFVLFLNRNVTTDEVEVIATTGGTTSGSGTTYNRYIGCQIRPVKEGTN